MLVSPLPITGYFTEKIMDCLLTKTIPIYWGCPNIADYFDPTGWLIMTEDSVEHLTELLQCLIPTYYNEHRAIIEKNYEKAQSYIYQNMKKIL